MKLLAYKPVLADFKNSWLMWYDNPDFVLEPQRKYVMHSGCHKEPEPSCRCGIYSTLDINALKNIYRADLNILDATPVVGIFQVLGSTYFDETTCVLRSKMVYLWGLIRPSKMPESLWDSFSVGMYLRYSSDDYYSPGRAREMVIDAARSFGLKQYVKGYEK